jgi:tetratricopeptide (TPR) repeat protein
VTEKSYKKFPLFFRVGLIFFGVALIILAEGLLRILAPPAPACQEDPFVGFAGKDPFFIRAEKQGRAIYQVNPRRARFFNPESFPAKKSDNTFRIFVLGGSVAMGFPFHEPGSFSRFLGIGLRELDHSRTYELINAGGFGYASYRVVRILREVINYDPDLIIIMSGHNEFLEKRTYGEIKDQGPALVALKTWLARFRVYCILKTAVFKIRGPDARPLLTPEVTWEKYSCDPVQAGLTLRHYEYNLKEMARISRQRNVPIIFLTLPCNLREFPPYLSRHGRMLSDTENEKWNLFYTKGLESIKQDEFKQALAYFNSAEKIEPHHADLQFQLGRTLWEKKDWDQAREKFWTAVRMDARPIRAFSEMNQMILDLARGQGVFLADAERAFSEKSTGHIPGDDWFLDHCHPDLPGHITMARTIIASMIHARLIQPAPDWPDVFNKACEDYQNSLPHHWLAMAYYRAAFETGLNVKRLDRGIRMAETAKKLDPANPKISNLIHTLTSLKETNETRE